ncbi:ATP-dependent DNA helicase RecG [Candidatus Uhrbacteria bacterium]|nr:ATP-dependent DNA helicase RecG [Candidatus Uhrbacteria bacterium]
MLAWEDPVAYIHGLTSHQRRVLKTLEVETVGQLLSVLPRRYDDYSRLTTLARVPTGVPVTVKVTVKEIRKVPTFRRRFALIRALVSDGTASIIVTWFNQPWLVEQIKPGTDIFLSGAVTDRPRFGRGFTNPLWEPATAETLAAGTVAPVYPLSGPLTQKTIRKILRAAVDDVAPPDDPIPDAVRLSVDVPSLAEAIRLVHRPASLEEAENGRRRFAFGELLHYQLALGMARTEADAAGAPPVGFDETFAKAFASSLPFELTDDQKKAVWAAVKDMGRSRPMRRLLQGDVGAGKTAVAAMLMALTFRAGASATLMAPTDLLAKQHFTSLRRMFGPHRIPVLLVTSSSRTLFEADAETELKASEAKERVARGRVAVVGTHALLERGQSPPDAGLAIVDEQHRFGVTQRETLIVAAREDGKVPHLLSMSATPIPRSLALTLLGDLDVSVIRTKPKGRFPIATSVVQGEPGRETAYQAIRDEVAVGHRAFVVCPLIDPSDALGAKSVEDEARRLSNGPLRGLRLGIVHGKLATGDRDAAMAAFASGSLDVLVATTVVEVGVDVPEATVMLIEGAERFGLAQLHQLRGRIGRSRFPSRCFLAASDDNVERERLRVLERTDDGFEVAEADLRLRGSGNVLGVEQSGVPLFRAARQDDLGLMAAARASSASILSEDPDLSRHVLLRDIVTRLRRTSHRE